MLSMTPSQLVEALLALIPQRQAVHLWGACGVGKSQIAAQVAERLKISFRDIRATLLDPVDLRGLPRIDSATNRTVWTTPEFLPTDGEGILLLDELTAAPTMVQAACYQLVLDRKLGEYVLPDGWFILAAGNPASERGATFTMVRPLRNRFTHITIAPNMDDWCKWALLAGIRPEIIAFLRFRPQLLHSPDIASDANAWPTPRSWEMASKVLNGCEAHQKTNGTDLDMIQTSLLHGTIGDAATAEFVGFMRLWKGLPSVDSILLNPTTAPVPDDISAQIAVATALGRRLTDVSISKGMQYLDRLPDELKVLAMRDAAARDNAITRTPEFVKFGVQYAEVIQ